MTAWFIMKIVTLNLGRIRMNECILISSGSCILLYVDDICLPVGYAVSFCNKGQQAHHQDAHAQRPRQNPIHKRISNKGCHQAQRKVLILSSSSSLL
jgi:hypothetical protein